MNITQPGTGRLIDLTADECLALAASKPVGRLAWNGPEGPTVVPVNYVLTGRRVHIRTTAYSAVARECNDNLVAFEVDELDADTRSGWSVLIRGRAHLRFGGTEYDRPDVWPAGVRSLQMAIDADEISGRRVV
jgi:hypothetical protein